MVAPRKVARLLARATLGGLFVLGLRAAHAQDAPDPRIQEFQRDYRAAYERQVAATNPIKVTFHREIASLPVDDPEGKLRVGKSKGELAREEARNRQLILMNQMNKMDLTYTRSGDRQRLDTNAVDPSFTKQWHRSVVLNSDGVFAVQSKPDSPRDYVLEFSVREVEPAVGQINQALVFVDAARQVGAQDTKDVLLGDEFEIKSLRAEPQPGKDDKPGNTLVVEAHRVKPSKISRIPRHIVKATLTLEPKHDYRMTHFVLVTNDENVATGTIEYGDDAGPQSLVPRKFIQDIRKDGMTHYRLETFTIKSISFDQPADDRFTFEAFGLHAPKPGEEPPTPSTPKP